MKLFYSREEEQLQKRPPGTENMNNEDNKKGTSGGMKCKVPYKRSAPLRALHAERACQTQCAASRWRNASGAVCPRGNRTDWEFLRAGNVLGNV